MAANEVLSRSLTLRSGERLANRLAKAAMTEGLADASGQASDGLVRLYERWAAGGPGLLISGNVQIDREHLERPGNVIIDRRPSVNALARLRAWAQAARSHGAGFWMQICHAGRQTPRTVNRHPKAPSAVPLEIPGRQFGVPTALSEPEIQQIVERFVGAALVAREAGFSGVQLHAAHGYLLSQFLSPRANLRRDRWGGGLENRARLLMTIVERTRAAVGRDFTLAVKLNSADFQRGGFSASDSREVAEALEVVDIDVLEISGGTYEQPRMMNMDGIEAPDLNGLSAAAFAREGYFLGLATTLLKRLRIPVMLTGGFRSADVMASALQKDGVSLIGLARPLCTDLDGPKRLLREGGALDRPEARVRLGPLWLGPDSPITIIKAVNGFGAISWFYQGLREISRGGRPDPALGVLGALKRERADQAAWLEAARRATTSAREIG